VVRVTLECGPCDQEIPGDRLGVHWGGGRGGEHRLTCPDCGVPLGEDKQELKPPEWRTHETYVETEQWTVADVEDVDRVFATDAGDGTVRLDLDGRAAPSAEIADDGSPVNMSIWFDDAGAEELVEQLVDAILEADR